MVAVVVTFDGTRLDSSDANTDWGNWNPSTGGAPASEGANAYQITTGAAANTGVVGRQSQSTTDRRGVDYLDPGTAVDYTAAANRLFYMKGYVSDGFDVDATFGCECSIGSVNSSNAHSYNVAGSGAALSVYSKYPSQGGYIITCIDPTIDTWADTADEGGAFDQTAVIWYAFGAMMANGNSKSENVAFDAIDYGTGLTLLSGDTGPQGKYTDFYVFDQDDTNNRWGAAIGGGDAVTCRGIMSIGGSTTATEFNDSSSIVTFPDGYHSRGLFGVNVNLDTAANEITDGALLIGQGTRNGVDANDTRPDYTVIGVTSTVAAFSHTLRNFRDVEYTSDCEVDGADIECMLLTQGTAHIQNSTIRTNSLTSVAVLQDPTFGTTTDLHDTTFVQTTAGVGHAVEISTAGNYTFTNLTWTGYGADTTDDAALDLTAATGTYNITVSGGSTPTYKKLAGATVNILQSVPMVWNVIDKDNVAISGAQVTAFLVSDNSSIMTATDTDVGGNVTDAYTASTPVDIYYRVRKSSTGATKYKLFSAFGTIAASTGFSATVTLIEDPNNNT